MKPRFFHFGNRSVAQHQGIITVAAELIDGTLYFGIAYDALAQKAPYFSTGMNAPMHI
jgi:hypothetical protein